ncbi:MAG: twin-arginine translocase TatA/TatE family subunit [Desulfovibrio sp.]|jgi:TatA/E family protein of Tat protein translocase|nr:twin-arginine translocase TatA/TatE family subunit [Desulfovibrio sp.]
MQEVLVIIVIGLLLFNWRKLPDFAGSIGKALTSFKKGLEGQEKTETPPAEQPEADARKTQGQDAQPKS